MNCKRPIKNLKKITNTQIPSSIQSSIILPKTFDVGYGKGQLRPNGSRSQAEIRELAKLTIAVNGMSGQQN